MTVILELNNTTVFNKGTLKGFKTLILTGGHNILKVIEGLKLEWKKAQKNLKKKKTSEKINHIILFKMFFCVTFVWNLK